MGHVLLMGVNALVLMDVVPVKPLSVIVTQVMHLTSSK